MWGAPPTFHPRKTREATGNLPAARLRVNGAPRSPQADGRGRQRDANRIDRCCIACRTGLSKCARRRARGPDRPESREGRPVSACQDFGLSVVRRRQRSPHSICPRWLGPSGRRWRRVSVFVSFVRTLAFLTPFYSSPTLRVPPVDACVGETVPRRLHHRET